LTEESKTITAIITYVRFNRGDFAILTVHPKGAAQTVTVKGNIMPGDLFTFQNNSSEVVFQGAWEEHAKFGKQFKFTHYYEYHPEDAAEISPSALANFIAGEIDGVGPINANKIIISLGGTEATVGLLEAGDERAANLLSNSHSLMDQTRAVALINAWGEKKAKMKVVSFFAELGISGIFPHRIFEKFGEGSISTIKANPYILIKHVDGIGFKRADDIAMKLGIESDSDCRLSAAILFTLEEKCWNAGNCYLLRENLVQAAKRLSRIPSSIIEDVMDKLVNEGYKDKEEESWSGGGLLVDLDGETGSQRIYIPTFYATEVKVAEKIKEMIA